MIHILLLILKIIGIVLLVILGLLLVILLAVLFIPVRYKAEGSYHGQPRLSARVSWLFRFIVFRASYSGDVLVCSFRILGIRLWHNKDKDAVQDLEDGLETVLGDEEQTLYEELQQDEANFRRSQESGQNSGQEPGKEADRAAADGSEKSSRQESGKEAGRTSSRDGDSGAGGRGNDETGEDARKTDQDGRSMPGRFVFGIVSRLKRLLEKLKFSFGRICDKLKGIREFAQEKKAWLEDEKNQASLRLLYRQTKRLAAHMWPRKGRGSVTFGFDDPYTTGQALQAASLIYPFYHRQLSLYPVFDETILEAEGNFKGRIRLAVVLWLALQIFFDRHTRRMLRSFLK